MKLLLSVFICFSFSVNAIAQTTIAKWTFETSVPATAGPHVAEVGAGNALGWHANGVAAYSNPVGNGSAESFSSDRWTPGDYYQFEINSTGYTGLTIEWDQISSSTGPRDFILSISTDGINFTPYAGTGGTYTVIENTMPNNWASSGLPKSASQYTLDLTSLLAINNQSTVYFRLVNSTTTAVNGGTVASGGSNRVDNFTVTGFPVLSINNVTLNEGNAGTTLFSFTVSLSAPAPAGGVTFDIATANNTATLANNDYVAKSLTSQVIPQGNTSYTFDVTVNGDVNVETNESFFVNVSNVTNATVSDAQGGRYR